MIPKDFVNKYVEESNGCTFFGVPIKDLTRDELIACAIAAWKAKESAIKEGARQREFLLLRRRA